MFNNLIRLTKILTKKQCKRFCFNSVGVQAVLKLLVSTKKSRQNKKLTQDKFLKLKGTFRKTFVVCEIAM